MIFYHGSKIGGIKFFEPQSHIVGGNKKIVFATNDKNYALAMIYGTGDEVAISYVFNPYTKEKDMYIDELQPGKLELLNNSGYLYEVESKYFQLSPEKLEGEYVSYESVPVFSEIKIMNIMDQLKNIPNLYLVEYENVEESMYKRGKSLIANEIKHSSKRFIE
ncbi:MAG: hypothetical protein AAB917_03050 [Patescibacteria group bacterium]